MSTTLTISSWTLILWSVAGIATAQQAASTPPAPAPTATKSTAQSDAGEPRANSVPTADGAAVADAPAGAARGASAPRNASKVTSAAGTAASSADAASRKGPAAADRVNLNTATVTGDHEQPKVMYIVPWKSANIGDLPGKPMNSLLDEALAPVDRDEFKREVAYYDAVSADAKQNAASPTAKQGEK